MFVAVLVGLSAVVLIRIGHAYRVLFFDAPLTASVFIRAAERFRSAENLVGARSLAAAGRPAWLAVALDAALGEGGSDRAADVRLDEAMTELRDVGDALLRPFRGLASLSSSLGMLFAILSLNGVGVPRNGLLSLQAGLVQTLALERAVSCVAVGGSTALVVLLSLAALRRQAHRIENDLARLASVFEASPGPVRSDAA